MPEFDSAFMKSKGQPIEYNGETLMRIDRLYVPKRFQVSVSLISTNSEWKQGVRIKTKGKMIAEYSKIESKSFIIWEDFIIYEPTFRCSGTSQNNELLVWNAWDQGDGVIQAWLGGTAMKKEILSGNHFRYYCNDGHLDENFDDIVFDIEIIGL